MRIALQAMAQSASDPRYPSKRNLSVRTEGNPRDETDRAPAASVAESARRMFGHSAGSAGVGARGGARSGATRASPAIDAGNNAADLASDQRGPAFLRVFGAAADIGAFEVQTAEVIFRDGFD